ncbi:UDP-4-amino-4,6-dideoxy-N-acetyl-beta-L-altrosamine transaminase [Cytobacillus firmus]|uniref:UDP-4-amino-4, 6-dideoxy-N-acetyl-beta-L-altrosamine transaminase n=1 Tax=Cytobacillus firmus TaxID=1399 RepID=UPI0018CE1553|nr:UDP-4-amino-4,6-dideoxy-N-acetyl-beta-L-altrosamine transaminase [Cytobacillus firmus]MBG9588624.1 aminotransferase DegT [Cytobacillus firmus]
MLSKEKLAIHGGIPVRDAYLPYGTQWIDNEDINAVINVLNSDYLTTGPKIAEFEKEVANYTGAKYAVSFSNGTAALHGACFAAGIKEGDEVITTPMTFAASANCILYQGAKPIFADINPDNYNVSPKSIENLITKKTKAIIAVDFAGQPSDLDHILTIAQEHNLIVIEDAAHSLGATYKESKIGSRCDMTMFSFHPVKHITTGEGGMITTNDKEFRDRLIQFRNHGITRDRSRFKEEHGPWYYEMQLLGYNYRMTDFQAALGLSQLKKLDNFIKRRKEIASMYSKAFENIEQIRIPVNCKESQSSWHLYVIRLNQEKLTVNRKEIFEALVSENIGVNVHYIPVYYHPYYHEIGYKKGLCPNSEKLYEEIITLPLFPKMSEKDIFDVIKAVKKVISFYSND